MKKRTRTMWASGAGAMAACVAVLAGAAGARAEVRTLTAVLDGLQEVPAVVTPGFGSATLMFDDQTGGWTLTGEFSSLVAACTNAHIHGFSLPGVNSGVLRQLVFDTATSGLISGQSSMGLLGGTGAFTSVEMTRILAGETYVNVHSSFRPGGEIRGQLVIPAPGAGAALALAGVVVAGRRRRGV